jgi:uncharacterized Zn-finger protein
MAWRDAPEAMPTSARASNTSASSSWLRWKRHASRPPTRITPYTANREKDASGSWRESTWSRITAANSSRPSGTNSATSLRAVVESMFQCTYSAPPFDAALRAT